MSAAPLAEPSSPPLPVLNDTFKLAGWEMFLMRLGFAILVFVAIKWEVGGLGKADPKKLSGLAHLVNLDFLRQLKHIWPWQLLTAAGLLVYVRGLYPALALLPALFFSLGIGSLANSQGAANHSTQLVSMILLGQFLVYAVALFRPGAGTARKPDIRTHGLAIQASLVMFAASYVVSAYSKFDNSDGHWIQRVPSLALELQKTNWSEYYDTLTPVPQSLNTVVQLMSDHPNMAKLLFGSGLLIEAFAFVVLFGRRWACFMGLAIIVMHWSISGLMQLDFGYHIAAAFIFLINMPGLYRTFDRDELEEG